jgi:HSP20 family protein
VRLAPGDQEDRTMLSRFDDLDRTFASMDHLRRHMDRLFADLEPARSPNHGVERLWSGRFPRLSFADAGESLVLEADLPGLGEKDLQLELHQDVLTLRGERRQDAPQGWFVHRQERAPVKFSRSFSLPCKIDPEKSTATLKNGVLTLTLVKATEAQPRQIPVKAQ